MTLRQVSSRRLRQTGHPFGGAIHVPDSAQNEWPGAVGRMAGLLANQASGDVVSNNQMLLPGVAA